MNKKETTIDFSRIQENPEYIKNMELLTKLALGEVLTTAEGAYEHVFARAKPIPVWLMLPKSINIKTIRPKKSIIISYKTAKGNLEFNAKVLRRNFKKNYLLVVMD